MVPVCLKEYATVTNKEDPLSACPVQGQKHDERVSLKGFEKAPADVEICYCLLTLHAVSKPKLMGTSLLFRSPSMVLGQPMTFVLTFRDLSRQSFAEQFYPNLLFLYTTVQHINSINETQGYTLVLPPIPPPYTLVEYNPLAQV